MRLEVDALIEAMVLTLGPGITADRAVLTTSFSKEDQLLTWAVVESGLDVDLVSLDTGCLFPATVQTWKQTEALLGTTIRALRPAAEDVQAFEEGAGLEGIYASSEGRKSCCHFRKIKPLRLACAGKNWWLTGLRKAHSANRSGMTIVEEAPDWGLRKFHPVLDWSDAVLDSAVKWTGVPVNPLYSLGYASIGCAPCTRPVLPGEDVRAGRWWWEQSSKECGLHRG